jgi:hypothetical protein
VSSHGKHRKRRRGCHKRSTSPEVRSYVAEHTAPPRPAWLERATYRELVALRQQLELGEGGR